MIFKGCCWEVLGQRRLCAMSTERRSWTTPVPCVPTHEDLQRYSDEATDWAPEASRESVCRLGLFGLASSCGTNDGLAHYGFKCGGVEPWCCFGFETSAKLTTLNSLGLRPIQINHRLSIETDTLTDTRLLAFTVPLSLVRLLLQA
jgi:hypothetical protein